MLLLLLLLLLRLRLARTRRLAVGLCVVCRLKGLPVCAIHGWRGAHAAPDRVCWDESLRLRRDRREDAVLVESQTVGAAAVLGGLEAGAANL